MLIAPEIKICIGVPTRDRPELLKNLLHSLSELSTEPQIETIVAIVENGPLRTLDSIITDFSNRCRAVSVVYDLEPRLGIAVARNRLMQIAIQQASDYLVFVDDDEVVDKNWLVQLVKTAIDNRLDLTGGPVRLLGPPADASPWQETVWASLARRSQRVEDRARNRSGSGQINKTVIVTNNWLGRLKFLEANNLRFDEQLGFSGGEDTKLYHAAVAQGARTGWASGAVVHEQLGVKRLSFRYQFIRARDQKIASFRTKYDKVRATNVVKAVAFIIYRSITGLALTVACIVRPHAFVADVARSFGSATGCILALIGRSSEHYRNISNTLMFIALFLV